MIQETKAFKRTIIFIIMFILLFSGLELVARTMYQTKTCIPFHKECFERVKNKIEILFFGSSHMEDGVNPQYIKKSFNLAFNAQDLYYDYMRLKKNIDEMPLLKTIVLELSFLNLFYDEGNDNIYNVVDYYWFLSILPRNRPYYDLLYYSSVFLLHQDTFIADLIAGKKPNPFPIMDIDHVPKPIPQKRDILLANGFNCTNMFMSVVEEEKEIRGRYAVMYHEKLMDKSLLEENLNYLNKIIDLGRKRNVRIIFITLPSIKYYRMFFKKEYLDLFYSTIPLLLKDHPEIEYYDLSDLKIMGDEDFLNASHLNYIGAKKFSIMLNSILNESKDNRMARLQELSKK